MACGQLVRAMLRRMLPLLLLFCGTTAVSRAQFVTPTSYTFNQAPTADGDFSYPDSGEELIDGATGVSFDHYADPSEAGVWTGWFRSTPSINFQFSSPQTFSRIEIGTTRKDSSGIGVLSGVDLNGTSFTTGISLADNTRDWLTFDGAFSTTDVGGVDTFTLSLTTASDWIMLDEVRFTAIPEPAEISLLCSLVAAGVFVGWRKRNPAASRSERARSTASR